MVSATDPRTDRSSGVPEMEFSDEIGDRVPRVTGGVPIAAERDVVVPDAFPAAEHLDDEGCG